MNYSPDVLLPESTGSNQFHEVRVRLEIGTGFLRNLQLRRSEKSYLKLTLFKKKKKDNYSSSGCHFTRDHRIYDSQYMRLPGSVH